MSDLREALERHEVASAEVIEGQKGIFIAPATLDDGLEVFEAASSYLALLQPCDQCDDGLVDTMRGERTDHCVHCSGRGTVPSDQAVRAFMESMVETKDVDGWLTPRAVRKGLAAAIFGEET